MEPYVGVAVVESFARSDEQKERERALEMGRLMPDVIDMVDLAEKYIEVGDHALAHIAADEALRHEDVTDYERSRIAGIRLRLAASEGDQLTSSELLKDWSAQLEDRDLAEAARQNATPGLLAELLRRTEAEPDLIYEFVQASAYALVDVVGPAEATALAQALFDADQWAGSPTAGAGS